LTPFITNPFRFGSSNPPDFEDNFSSDSGWTYVGTVTYNASGYQNLIFARNGDTDNGCYHDLTTVSNSGWRLRAKWHLTAKQASGQSSFLGLTSVTGASSETQDAIGVSFTTVNNTLFTHDCDGSTIAAGSNSSNAFTTTNGDDYFIQIRRLTETTMRVEIFPDDTFDTADITINDTIPSTIQSTTYLKEQNRAELSNKAGQSDDWTGDDVQFWDNLDDV